MKTILDLSKALETHPINAPDMRGDYTHHMAGLTSEIGRISRLTAKTGSLSDAETQDLGLSISTGLLLLASIAYMESIDLEKYLPEALKQF